MNIDTSFDDENRQVLFLNQALLGAIMDEMRAVGIKCLSDRFVLTFLLRKDSAECREEIDDIAFEFEALQSTSVTIDVNVIIDTSLPGEIGNIGRLVFRRKEE